MNCLIETILIRIKSIETMLGAGIASIKLGLAKNAIDNGGR